MASTIHCLHLVTIHVHVHTCSCFYLLWSHVLCANYIHGFSMSISCTLLLSTPPPSPPPYLFLPLLSPSPFFHIVSFFPLSSPVFLLFSPPCSLLPLLSALSSPSPLLSFLSLTSCLSHFLFLLLTLIFLLSFFLPDLLLALPFPLPPSPSSSSSHPSSSHPLPHSPLTEQYQLPSSGISEDRSSRLELGYREPKHMDPGKARQAERLGMGVGRIGWASPVAKLMCIHV